MLSFKRKVTEKKIKQKETAQDRQDKWSVCDFKDGLKKGKTEVGSLLFSGDDREEKLIKQLCRYYGYKYIGKKNILCQYPDATNTFYVTHYTIEDKYNV